MIENYVVNVTKFCPNCVLLFCPN